MAENIQRTVRLLIRRTAPSPHGPEGPRGPWSAGEVAYTTSEPVRDWDKPISVSSGTEWAQSRVIELQLPPDEPEVPDLTHPHLIKGEFQSDKYPTTPRGKVPLSVRDKSAQDLLWDYASRRRAVDREFAVDLELALLSAGYEPEPYPEALLARIRSAMHDERMRVGPSCFDVADAMVSVAAHVEAIVRENSELARRVAVAEAREKEARRTAEDWRQESNENADAVERNRQAREEQRRRAVTAELRLAAEAAPTPPEADDGGEVGALLRELDELRRLHLAELSLRGRAGMQQQEYLGKLTEYYPRLATFLHDGVAVRLRYREALTEKSHAEKRLADAKAMLVRVRDALDALLKEPLP